MNNQTKLLSTCTAKLRLIAAAVIACLIHVSPCKAADIPSDLMVDLDSLTVSKGEFLCLALNDYFEARGESLPGRLAVAKVVLNRVMDSRFPSRICDVVRQNKTRSMHRCQFSWYCDGRSDKPYDRKAWRRSLKMAAAVLIKDSSIADPTGGALWYHAVFVHPKWAGRLNVSGIVGGHIFYSDSESVRLVRSQERHDHMVPALHRFAEWVDGQKPRPTAVASR
ncbi:MAG: cell wall hydrolase [Rhodospirillaceae bacterium]